MSVNYEWDLWQFKNMIEGREELDKDWMLKIFTTYFNLHHDREVAHLSEINTEDLGELMYYVDEQLRYRLEKAGDIRHDFGLNYKDINLPHNFRVIDLADGECGYLNEGDVGSDYFPEILLGENKSWEQDWTKECKRISEKKKAKIKEAEDIEYQQYLKLKDKFGG